MAWLVGLGQLEWPLLVGVALSVEVVLSNGVVLLVELSGPGRCGLV